MRKLLSALLIGVLFAVLAATSAQAGSAPRDITDDFTCPVFMNYAAPHRYIRDPAGRIYCEDVASTVMLFLNNPNITSLDGIVHFTSLRWLIIEGVGITTLDISGLHALEGLSARDLPLTSVYMRDNPALWEVTIHDTPLTDVDVSNLPALEDLWVFSNQLTELDVSNNPVLIALYAGGNRLTSINLSNNPLLEELSIWGNYLTELDVSNNPRLFELNVGSNRLSSLDVSNNPYLEFLNAWGNQLTELNISNNPNLESLRVWNNHLTELDVSGSIWLIYLDAGNNRLTTLDVSYNIWLEYLNVSLNRMQSADDVIGWREIELEMTENFVFMWLGNIVQPQPTPTPAPQVPDPRSITITAEDSILSYTGLTGHGIAVEYRICRAALGRSYERNSLFSANFYDVEILIGPMASGYLYHSTYGSYIYLEFIELERAEADMPRAFMVVFIDENGNNIDSFGGMIEILIPFTRPQGWNPGGIYAKTLYVSDETGDIAWEMILASLYWYGDLIVTLQESQIFTVGYDFITFPDMPEYHEYKGYIEVAASRRLVSGFPDGSFRPDAYITRAEFVQMLYNVLNLPYDGSGRDFIDVRPDSWYYASIMALYSAGALDDVFFWRVFYPAWPITHGEAWQIMANLGMEDMAYYLRWQYFAYDFVTRAEAVFYQMMTLFYMYW